MNTMKTVVLISLYLLQGCASVSTQFYSLEAVSTQRSENIENHANTSSLLIGVTQISLPNVLERKQIVTRDERGELVLFEQHQWVGLLKQNMTEVMAKDFSNNYPHFWFKAYPWSTIGMVDYRLVIDVTQLDIVMGKSIHFAADWALLNEKTHTIVAHDRVMLEHPLQENTVSHVVLHLNQLLAEFVQAVHFSHYFSHLNS